MIKSIKYWLHKLVDFTLNPKLLAIRATGAVADTYMKLDEKWIHDMNIDTILDVGGNIGRFSKTMQYLFPNADIIAFEPLPDCYIQMNKLMNGYPKFSSLNIGLGTESVELNIKKSSHNPSSSFLPMTNTHKEAFPFTAGFEEVKVKVERLDDVVKSMKIGKNLMIKVDVQGFEENVIRGGLETFSKAKFLLLELSYQELYQNQPLFDNIYKLIAPLGFAFYGTLGNMSHPLDGSPLDSDCIFIKI